MRLPKLPADPAFEDMQYALALAQKNHGQTIELVWMSSVGQAPFMLTIKCDPESGNPCWTMHRGEGPDAKTNWTYVTGDLQLIMNLVISECSGGTLQDVSHQGSYVLPRQADSENRAESAAETSAPAALDGSSQATILEGNLQKVQTFNLLQSIMLSKLTGRLAVQSSAGEANIYFEDGLPVHAQVGIDTGDPAVLELLAWEEGLFHFYPDAKSSQKSVGRRLDALLMEGAALVDQARHLNSLGLKMQSYVVRKHKNLTEVQFEQMLAKAAPLDMGLQKRFYQSINNKSTLFELLRKTPLSKTSWLPLMFNLATCDLVLISDMPDSPARKTAAPELDQSAIQSIARSLQRPETGLFTYPAFLFFAEQEFFRFQDFGLPFSILIFEMNYRPSGPNGPLEPLPIAAVKEIAERVSSVKRKNDLLAHYETFDFACLLPNANISSAMIFANRMVELILSVSVPDLPVLRNISLSIALGSVPEDCQELGLLLARTRHAKNKAREQGLPIILCRDMQAY